MQGRADLETVEVPCVTNPTCSSSWPSFAPAPSLISSLLPWTNHSSGGCGSGSSCGSSSGMLCSGSSTSTDCQAGGSSATCMACSGSAGQLEGFQPDATLSCNAFFDASSLTAAGDRGGFGPAGGSAAMPAPVAAAETGVLIVEREVVYPGCPMNSYPGKNLDNSQCIMCGEISACFLFVSSCSAWLLKQSCCTCRARC